MRRDPFKYDILFSDTISDPLGLDPYDDSDEGDFVPMYTPNETTEEEGLYHELLGRYQACPDNSTCYDQTQWDYFNGVMDTLIERGHQHYSRFKIAPRTTGNGRSFVEYSSFRMNMMSAIQRMSRDFTLVDPNYALYQYSPKNAPSFYNSNATDQHNNLSQVNNQRVSVTLTLEQKMTKLDQEIAERLSPEQVQQIQPLIEQFKEAPTVWANAQKLISGVLGFGKDIATNVISAIIAFYLIPR